MKTNKKNQNFNFWRELPKPFFGLAPMADVTDTAFRRLVSKYSSDEKGDGHAHLVIWNEFIAADGLVHPIGREKLLQDLDYDESERPLIAQIFSGNPEHMAESALLCKELGFDGIDINMGCPDRGVEKQLSGAALIKNPQLAIEIIQAVKKAVGDMPVSVKTRVGYNVSEIETWIPALLDQDIQALTVHARTKKDLSKVPANWDYIKQVVSLRNGMKKDTLIIGNGDINNMLDGYERARESGCDGIMIGRGFFGKPWLCYIPTLGADPSVRERLRISIEHAELFERYVPHKNFAIMKKHFRVYANGFDHAHELRNEIMERGNSAKEVREIIERFLKEHSDEF